MADIQTVRLRLRAPRAADAARIAEMLGEFEVAGNLARVPHPYAIEDAESWLEAMPLDPPPRETAFMIATHDGDLIGNVGFHERWAGIADIGYYIGKPFWGNGFATEAAKAALGWYFDASGADRVRSGVFHFNEASLAVQRKLGFVTIGTSDIHCLARGETVMHIDTELTREAFRAAIQ